jgi:hypothetical protein
LNIGKRFYYVSLFVIQYNQSPMYLVTISAVLFVLLVTSVLKYLHHRLIVMRGRAVWDQERDEGLLWQWIGLASGEGGALNSYNREG